ncbi:hypothetical protein Lal_00030089 [Lupinus albus]|nr:hypothetical protein Lal_00030089 [Lupinus albus]
MASSSRTKKPRSSVSQSKKGTSTSKSNPLPTTINAMSSKNTFMDAQSSLPNTINWVSKIMQQIWYVRGSQSPLPYAIFMTKILEHFGVSLDGETKVTINISENKIDVEVVVKKILLLTLAQF